MSGSSELPPWALALLACVPGGLFAAGPKVFEAWRAWRGDSSAARVAQERVDLDERVQVAARQAALDLRTDAEVARLGVVHTELRTALATEIASGQHWYQIARAWWSRAWDKLSMARGMRDDIIEAREFAANERRVWFAVDPNAASAARRPSWMGTPPDFAITEPPPIPDPPGLEDLLK